MIPAVPAATFLWGGGGGNNNWGTAGNWTPSGAPTTGGTNQDLQFAGSIRTSPSANGATAWSIRTITFNNGASAFTIGGTTINLGTGGLVNNSSNTQSLSNALSLQAGQTWNAATGNLSLSGTINLNATALALSGANNFALSNAISGTGSLTLGGTGTVTLSGSTANTFSGTTTVNAGTLILSKSASINAITGNIVIGDGAGTDTVQLAASNQIADTSAITINSSGVLDLNGNSETVGSISAASASAQIKLGAGTLTVGNASNTTIAGTISGPSGNLTKQGAGTVTLTGSNSYSGTTNVTGGTLIAGSANALGTALSTMATNVSSGATLALQGNVTLSSAEAISLAGTGDAGNGRNGALDNLSGNNTVAGSVAISSATKTGAASGTQLTLGGQVTGSAALTVGGTGTVVLANSTNSYSGAITVNNAATLAVAANNALGATATGAVTVTAGGNLVLQGGVSVSKDTPGTPLLTLNGTGISNGGALSSTGGNNQWNGDISLGSSATITSATTGNVLTIGNNSYTNTLSLGASTLTVDGTGNLLFNAIVGAAGDTGSFVKNGPGTTTFSGNTNNYTGTTTVNAGTLILDTDSSPTYYNQTIRGNLTIGTGSLALTPDGVVVQYGAPSNNRNKISDTSVVTINSDGKLDLNSNDDTIGSLVLNGGHITTGVGVLTLNGDVTANTNSASQTAVIDGVLALGSSVRTFTVASGGLTSDLTVNAKINSGSFIKAGAGTMTITSDNVTGGGYTGTTTVSAGVLQITNGNALGGTSNNDPAAGTTVASGAALQLSNGAGLAVGNEALSLSGTGISNTGALRNISGNNSWAGAVNLATDTRINSDANTLTVGGTISGTNTSLTVGGSGNTTISGAIGTNLGGVTKDGTGTLVLSGGSTYHGTTTISAGVVNVQNTYGLGAVDGGTSVAASAELQVQGNIAVGSEALALNGTGTSGGGALRNLSGNNSWSGDVTLGSAARINSDSGTLTLAGNVGSANLNLTMGGAANTTLNGVIGLGSGTLAKDGTGTLTIGGSSANTFTGTLNINDGTVVLAKTVVPNTTVNGNIVVGDGVGSTNSAVLQLGVDNQIADTSAVTINADGNFDLNGHAETIGTLTANAGSTLTIGSGTLITSGGTIAGSLTGSGILQTGGNLTITSNHAFAGTVQATGGILDLTGAGASFSVGTLTLGTGTTLKLGANPLAVGTLSISGASTIDFGNGTSATLAVGAFNLGGNTISVTNWVNGADYFYVQSWAGATLGESGRGQVPENQVSFAASTPGFPASSTAWLPYDPSDSDPSRRQITPAPEPSTYGAIFMGLSLLGLGFRRWRTRRPPPASFPKGHLPPCGAAGRATDVTVSTGAGL